MANLQNFVFFDGPSTATYSNVLALMPSAGAIIIHVETKTGTAPSGINFQLEASSDVEVTRQGIDNYSVISVVNLGDFSTADAISAPGIYMAVFPAATRVRAKNTGTIDENLKVFGTVIE